MKEKMMEKYLQEKEKDKPLQSPSRSKKNEVSWPEEDVKVLPKERVRHAPPCEGRHEKFQLGTNPMAMTPFEKELVHKEKEDRRMARDMYVAGIQGRDGGRMPYQQSDNEWPDKF